MKEKEYLLNLLDYNSWANNEFFKTITTLSVDEINKQRKSFMNSIRNSLNHLLVIDKIWLANMKKQKHSFNNLQTILHENIRDLWEAKKNEEIEIKKYQDSFRSFHSHFISNPKNFYTCTYGCVKFHPKKYANIHFISFHFISLI